MELMMRWILWLLTSLYGASAAGAWNVIPCGASIAAQRADFAANVRAARQGSPLFTPVPFPRTDAEVVRDLTEYVTRTYAAGSTSRFVVIANGMRRGQYRYEVHRVADWTPGRCAAAGNTSDAYFLIVIRDNRTNTEIARATVYENGLFGMLGVPFRPDDPMVSPGAATRRLIAAGVESDDAQYVATEGGVKCHRLRPCVASRNRSGIFIIRNNEIWLLPLGGRIHSLRTIVSDKGRSDFVRSLASGESYVTLGADAIVVARKLD